MESSKRMMMKSDSSSEESDQNQQVLKDGGNTRRFYECTYCKRGFTNAQALGGHMNIHRKDRAKPNQKHDNNSSISKAPSVLSHDHTQRYNNMYVPQMDYSTPAYFPQLDHYRDVQSFGTSLGLRIGSEFMGDRRVDHDQGKEQVDLELRLGPYHY